MAPKGKGRGRGRTSKAPTADPKVPTKETTPTADAQTILVSETDTSATREQATVSGDTIHVQAMVHATQDEEVTDDENDDDDAPIQKKKKKIPETLTTVQEQVLVEWFSEKPIFFDQTLRDFKNKQKKDRILQEKAKEFGLTGEELGIWFKSQRTIYGRLSKKKSGQARKPLTARQKWVMENFSFLKSHIVVRSDTRQLGKVPTPLEQSDAEAEEYEVEEVISHPQTGTEERGEIEEVSGPGNSGSHKRSQSRKRSKAGEIDDALLTLMQRLSGNQTMEKKVDEALSSCNNPRTAWVQWMGAELQDLPDDLWTQYQRESFALVIKFKEAAQRIQVPPQQQTPQTPFIPQVPPRPDSAPTPSSTSFAQSQFIGNLPSRPATAPLAGNFTSYAPVQQTQDWSQVVQQRQTTGLLPTQGGITPLMNMNFSSRASGQDSFSLSQLLADSQSSAAGEPSTNSDVGRITPVLQGRAEENGSYHDA